jgi:hypothetical protein
MKRKQTTLPEARRELALCRVRVERLSRAAALADAERWAATIELGELVARVRVLEALRRRK